MIPATTVLWGLVAGTAIVTAGYLGVRILPGVVLPTALYPYAAVCVNIGYLGLVYAAPSEYPLVQLAVGLLGFVAFYFATEAGDLFVDRLSGA